MYVKAASKTLASAKGALYPNLSLSAGINTSYANTIKEGFGPITTGTQTIGYLKSDPTALVETASFSQERRTVPFGDQLSNNFGQNIGLSLSIPIFNGWRARGNVERARIDVQDRQLTLDINRQKLRQDVYTAHANAVGAFQKYQAAITTERASQKAYDFATKRFNVGLMNTVEYITTQTNLFKAQIDKVSALYDYIFKIKLLEFYRDQRITL
jgi:outer membrane protein